ncbi:MAG: HopJ type III effector protein [Methylococcaceae bacterium]|nr:HopJ type III effector protein [Methylococcaceae bacterium]
MKLEAFLDNVKSGGKVSFQDSIAVIAANYEYTPTRFVNGSLINEAGVNEGSCKLFYFAKLHGLSPDQTLSLFGDYYWKEVLENPQASNHANIRAFMKQGWAGIAYDGDALKERP